MRVSPFLLGALWALLGPVASAQTGALDPSFGDGGVATLPLGRGGKMSSSAVFALPDGGTLLVGNAWADTAPQTPPMFALTRLAADGSRDPSFGDGGTRTDALTWSSDARAAAVLPDGRIVVGGTVKPWGGSGSFGVARYTANGDLDATFGAGGHASASFGRYSGLEALALQPDGRLIAVGSATNSSSGYDVGVMRFTAEGALDPTFGVGGRTTISFPSGNSTGTAVVVQPDGRIVVGGRVVVGEAWHFALVRLTASGTPDASFGSGGRRTINVGAGLSNGVHVHALTLQPDGRLIAAGTGGGATVSAGFSNLVLTRSLSNGDPDPSFGSSGIVRTVLDDRDTRAFDVALQPDGRLVVAGQAGLSDAASFAVFRYAPDGSPDPTFGEGGVARVPMGAYALALTADLYADGRIVAAGTAGDAAVVARLDAGGDPDATFSGDGRATVSGAASGSDVAYDVAVQPDGRLVAVGPVLTGTTYALTVLRLTADGRLDPSFGDGGLAGLGPSAGSPLSAATRAALVVQPDGRLLIASEGNGTPLVARLLPDGSADPSFGSGGVALLNVGAQGGALFDLVVQPDGRLLAVGEAWNGSSYDALLVRLTADGARDGSFGENGVVRTVGGINHQGARAVALQPDGRIVTAGAVGASPTGPTRRFVVRRYLADGALDPSFGTSGTLVTAFGFPAAESCCVAVDAGGGVLVAGTSYDPGYPVDFVVARYTADGVLDPAFGSGGLATAFAHGADEAHAMLVDPSGRIVVAGTTTGVSGGGAGLARFTPDGRLDTTLGEGGQVYAPLGVARAVALQPDGGLVVAGNRGVLLDQDIFLARFLGTTTAAEAPAEGAGLALRIAPNPSVGATAIRYSLPLPGAARLTVVDLLGREVAVLADAQAPAGEHTAAFDAGTLAPGTYVVRLSTPSGAVTRRLTVLR